ncbi:MAG TPA: 4-alpha-glucanotransferase [Thermoanaerobaculia bacterium]|nr:4-alpha-glucanotransferase [Thermoanaerobaculia bacterium]
MKADHLRELARLYSVQTTYEDAAGKTRKASKESLIAALRLRLPEGADLSDALSVRREAFWRKPVDPVTVVWGRRSPAVELRLPRAFAAFVGWRLTFEDGSKADGRIDLSDAAESRVDGEFIARTVTIPHKMPYGYHTLIFDIDGRDVETLIVAAPTRARGPKERSWGIFLPLYAARSADNWGIGDLRDMVRARQWVNELGGGVVAALPLLAAFEDEPSPYSPVSRLFWNELYLDVEKLPEWSNELRDVLSIRSLQSADHVDYERASRVKRAALETMATRFSQDEDFVRFASRGAYGYAHFRAAKEERDSANYHLYVQYRMAQQMREIADDARSSGIGLYLDFPLGVNAEGFDAWKYARSFVKGVSVGAPPDLFFTKGQNWGFPPFDPDGIREDRYEYFRACIRHHVSHAGVLRLDHVMGLHRLFWIPEGGEAKDGVYVRYPEEEMYAIVVLEAHKHGCAVVGEDLGTVPEYVPRMMNRHGFRRMYVVQYELKPEEENPAGEPPAESVASINTHDMPTFAAFWRGADIDDRLEQRLLDRKGAEEERGKREQMRQALTRLLKAQGLLSNDSGDTKAVLEGVLRFLSGSPAEIVLVNIEDLWLETQPQNVPGVPERSWKQKFRLTMDEIRKHPEIKRILEAVDAERRKGVHGRQA